MDAIIRILRPGQINVRSVRRRNVSEDSGLVALHPTSLWGQVCVTPGADFITRPHTENDQTWLFYPDSVNAPRRGILLEIDFGNSHTSDRIELARSLTRTLQLQMPATPIHTNEIPLRIADTDTDVEYLEWEDQPLEQLRFTRNGRRITLAGWRSSKFLPVLAEDDLRAVDADLLDALAATG